MTQIIGLAGRKQSGKNACCNFLTMLKLTESGVCERVKQDTETGELLVSDVFGERSPESEFMPFKKPYIDVEAALDTANVVKIYSIAGSLKRIAIDVLGLDENKVYGTDADKMTHTSFRWENMPGVMSTEKADTLFNAIYGYKSFEKLKGLPMTVHQPGPMTIREVLQYVGTDIFRKINPNIWIDTAIRRIEEDRPEVALVCDARFDNEINILKEKNGIVVGLRRDIFNSKDTHASERINFDLCNGVIDNRKMSMDEQNEALFNMLREHNCKNIRSLGI